MDRSKYGVRFPGYVKGAGTGVCAHACALPLPLACSDTYSDTCSDAHADTYS